MATPGRTQAWVIGCYTADKGEGWLHKEGLRPGLKAVTQLIQERVGYTRKDSGLG